VDGGQKRLHVQSKALRWLTHPGDEVGEDVRPQLLSSPNAIVMGAISGLLVSGTSIALDGSPVFLLLAALECAILLARIVSIRRLGRMAKSRHELPGDMAILLSCAWCALQGVTAFFAMQTGDATLMVVSATMVMALIGPLCARN